MHDLRVIRPLTKLERQSVERLYKQCEAPGCTKQPECVITLEKAGEEPLIVYACIDHAKSWANDEGNAGPETGDDSA